jgi:hypothetical protein
MMCPTMAALRSPRDPSATGVPLRSKTRRRARGLFFGVSVDVIIASCARRNVEIEYGLGLQSRMVDSRQLLD